MKTVTIKGSTRVVPELSSQRGKALKELRKQDLVPCVLYGGKEVYHLTIPVSELRQIVYTPLVYVVDINIDGKETVNSIMKAIQFHPVTDNILHVDFYEINEDRPIQVRIPVALEGLAEGVRLGGKLNFQSRRLMVKGFYKNIPEKINVDISGMLVGDSIHVGDIETEGYSIIEPKEKVVCSVNAARSMATADADDLLDEEEETEEGEEEASAEE
mgnify:CR=1 FL=1